MPKTPELEPPRIYPGLRYNDAHAMIDWLIEAFGFEKRVVYDNPDGTVAHAELAFGSSIVMLGSIRDDKFAGMVGKPEGNNRAGQAVYIAIGDTDAHYERAKAAGAEILMELTDTDYGSRDYICRDPEGAVWCFGTYWPKAGEKPL